MNGKKLITLILLLLSATFAQANDRQLILISLDSKSKYPPIIINYNDGGEKLSITIGDAIYTNDRSLKQEGSKKVISAEIRNLPLTVLAINAIDPFDYQIHPENSNIVIGIRTYGYEETGPVELYKRDTTTNTEKIESQWVIGKPNVGSNASCSQLFN